MDSVILNLFRVDIAEKKENSAKNVSNWQTQ